MNTDNNPATPAVLLSFFSEDNQDAEAFTAIKQDYSIVFKAEVEFWEGPLSKEMIKEIDRSLQKLILFANSNNIKDLIITTFTPFEFDSSLSLLKRIKDSNLKCLFWDFQGLSGEGLKCLIEVTERRKNSRKYEPDRDDKDKNENHHLNDPQTRAYTQRRKLQSALLDINNRSALVKLKDLQKETATLTDLAEALNTSGVPTSRGKTHTAKSVSRLLEKSNEIARLFDEDPRRERKVAMLMNAEPAFFRRVKETVKEELPLVWEGDIPDYEDQIVFRFSEPLKTSVVVNIYDNNMDDKPEAYFFSKKIKKGEKELKIDILKETALLPGRHYVFFQPDGKYNELWKIMSLYKDICAEMEQL